MTPGSDLQRLIHEIGRGPRGARDLSPGDARVLWEAILDGRLSQAAVGAALMAMRVKGESLDELRALREALHERLPALAADVPLVCMPCYNGARRVPNLSWLTALALRRAGFAVLLHGVRRDAQRLATCEVVEAAGSVIADSVGTARRALATDRIAFLPIDAWCAPLAAMLALRAQIGVRNSGHSVAKWLRPDPQALLLVPVTHHEYLESAISLLSDDRGPAIVFRGVDGEPALYPHAPRTVHCIAAAAATQASGSASTSLPASETSSRTQATARVVARELRPTLADGERDAAITLPAAADAREVADWSAAVIRGERPMPSMIDALVAQVRATQPGARGG